MDPAPSAIGVFDSGVGGLSVLRAIHKEVPAQAMIFLADQAHVPYGPRPLAEVRQFSEHISRYLIDQGASLVVVACNTASAAALHYLRQAFPSTPFVGMEPAVKPAAETTASGVVGVLATPATFQGALYASVVERFAQDVRLMQSTCPGLVRQIEAGDLDGPQTRQILEEALLPMLAAGIDTVVLGCTHYPFVMPLIQQIAGPGVRVIDPAPAVARQVRRVLEQHGLLRQWPNFDTQAPARRFLTSGSPENLAALLPELWGQPAAVGQVIWQAPGSPDGRLVLAG